jgi:hypothetical protein
VRRVFHRLLLGVCCAAAIAAHSQRSALQWEVRDIDHPRMGPIKVAVQKDSIATAVGSERIVSQVFLSCEKTQKKIAIELANAPESNATGGLAPKRMPRLVCESGAAKSELATSWQVSDIGDALARGLSASALRRCRSIAILQDIALPKGWARDSERIRIDLDPSGEALDSVLAECGGTAAPENRVADAPWKPARTIAKGRSNVRAAPNIDSAVVTQLEPGTKLLVQPAAGDWWKAKPPAGGKYDGYIRRDRLVNSP